MRPAPPRLPPIDRSTIPRRHSSQLVWSAEELPHAEAWRTAVILDGPTTDSPNKQARTRPLDASVSLLCCTSPRITMLRYCRQSMVPPTSEMCHRPRCLGGDDETSHCILRRQWHTACALIGWQAIAPRLNFRNPCLITLRCQTKPKRSSCGYYID